ncbi:PP2C family protein-serine/threonine phosphatase [Nocardioides sp.]|uniref:PP2C family protein-serine/threonine phosphatase n=1 Tax=Nocardioides sp. TaxID=35761 RepID=UPI00286D5D0C|nr:PP2C family protein-serine/threonine phosphatase [Nocardioides sp.]
MHSGPGSSGALSRHLRDRVRRWSSGSAEGQREVLLLLVLGVTISFAVSVAAYDLVPTPAYFVWLIVAMLLLRFRPLAVMTGWTATLAVAAMVLDGPINGPRAAILAALAVAVALILFQSSRQRSGLPSPLSEIMLAELKKRLQAQGTIPPLPAPWHVESAMIAADGVGYAGDFLVADLDEEERFLELILVDVVGKGLGAGPHALQFAGALGGLVGALEPRELMAAANRFLLRRHLDESFATAVHVRLDLTDGRYTIASAGHPPALRWHQADGGWVVDNARGMALGIQPTPDLDLSEGVLGPGDALLFYTDGVVESRTDDLDVGIDWLRDIAGDAIREGAVGSAQRMIKQVTRGDDDRAVLLLTRLEDASRARG